jgi:hypothetical protein
MHEQDSPSSSAPRYPTGRGYGHDLMRGGEVFGGYGYAERPEYERRRGERPDRVHATPPGDRPPTV